jgi:anti-sigma factor RsiW
MTTPRPIGQRPSDEELMQLLDGELDEARCREVASWLGAEAELAAKLETMALVGELVRENVERDERADAVADAVMAKLVEEPTGPQAAEVVSLGSRRLRHYAKAEPANQNARSIYWLAGIAAAVAAGLFFWSRAGLDQMDLATGPSERPASTASAVALAPSDSSLEPKWVTTGPPVADEADEEPGHAVEVAAVDFGSHTGSVFYVSAGHSGAATTTAVVWVTDSGSGK